MKVTELGVRQLSQALATIDNVDRINELTEIGRNSSGEAMKAQEIWAESLDARMQSLTNTVQVFWQNFINSDLLKGSISLLDNLVKSLSGIQKTFGGLGSTIGIVTTAMLLFTNNPLKNMSQQMVSSNTSIKSLMTGMIGFSKTTTATGVQITAFGITLDTARVKAIALQSVLSLGLGLGIGAVISLVTSLIGKFKDWYNSAEQVSDMSQKLSETLSGIKTTNDLSKEYKALHEKLKETNLTLEEQEGINERIVQIRNELSNDGEFADIINNENLDLETQLGLIKAINDERKYDDAKALEQQMTKGGFNSNENKVKTNANELKQYIDDYELLMALQKANKGKSFEFKGTTYDFKSQNVLIKEYESAIRESYISIEEWNSNVKKVEDSLGKTDLALISTSGSIDNFMKSFLQSEDAIKKTNSGLKDTKDTAKALSDEEKSINAFSLALKDMGYSADEVSDKMDKLDDKSLDGISNSLNQIATTRYGESIDEMTSLYQTIDKINEAGAMTPQIISDLAKQFPEMGSAIFNTGDAVEFLKGKIGEWQDVQNQAYAQMMGDNAEYYQTLLANGNQMQVAYDELISKFVGANSSGYEIDTNNFNTLNEAKSKMGANVVNAMADYLATMVGGNASGYRVDLNNFSSLAEQKVIKCLVHTEMCVGH